LNKTLISFIVSLACISTLSANTFLDNLIINSDTVEVRKNSSQIVFLNDVQIETRFLSIKADIALYDNIKKIMTLKGNPSLIQSTSGEQNFNGDAEEIVFYSNSKIHLLGNASMDYDNIKISSSSIIFNPQNGIVSSDE
jgi:lipopolysaccharide transport protein LptA|tara:strand:+ start:227 stop:643 length:417 start_codon:yes stop_codon:yes gene_type:complete